MTDIIRCEGLGSVSLLDLVDRLSSPNQTFSGEDPKSENGKEAENGGVGQSRKSNLKSKPCYPCPVDGCERTFCKEAALNNHKTRHNRVYKCDECGKCFSEQAKVKFKREISKNYIQNNIYGVARV